MSHISHLLFLISHLSSQEGITAAEVAEEGDYAAVKAQIEEAAAACS